MLGKYTRLGTSQGSPPYRSVTRLLTRALILHGGAYDCDRKDELKLELEQLEPHSDILLDLVRTEYLDCSCLGVLIAKLLTWREHDPDTKLRMRNVAANFARTLSLLKLDEVFVIESVRSDRTGLDA